MYEIVKFGPFTFHVWNKYDKLKCMKYTGEKIRWGFKGDRQLPFFMVWKEYWQCGEIEYASVLFNSMDYENVVDNYMEKKFPGYTRNGKELF